MDDLDEDEETGAAQVLYCLPRIYFKNIFWHVILLCNCEKDNYESILKYSGFELNQSICGIMFDYQKWIILTI